MDTAVGLVESYLRMNGYFTVTEFSVQHADEKQPGHYATATDLDVLAIRLPWTAEDPLSVPTGNGGERCAILLAGDPALGMDQQLPDVLIGEVKEGAAELNKRLLTPQVLHTVLRRIGCAPGEYVADAVSTLLRRGEVTMRPPRGLACRVRLASFCGFVDEPPDPAVAVITLDHALQFIRERLDACRAVLQSAQFKDPALAMLKLMEKLRIGMTFKES